MESPASAPSNRIREALFSAPEQVDLSAIAQHFVKLVGGPAAIAKLLYDEYVVVGEGSPVRARIMEMVLRAFTKLEAKYSIPDDLSIMSDEDLERAGAGLMLRIGGENGHVGSPAAAQGEARTAEEATRSGQGPAASASDAGAGDHPIPDRPADS